MSQYMAAVSLPSITTIANSNPAFRRYTFDAATYQLTDYTQYYLDLAASNNATEIDAAAPARWAVEYSFMNEYRQPAVPNASAPTLVLDSSAYFELYLDVSAVPSGSIASSRLLAPAAGEKCVGLDWIAEYESE
jgi:hypothetical protein